MSTLEYAACEDCEAVCFDGDKNIAAAPLTEERAGFIASHSGHSMIVVDEEGIWRTDAGIRWVEWADELISTHLDDR